MTDEIDTHSESYRIACEARHVAALPDHAARTAYLAGVADKRGEPAMQALRSRVWEVMKADANQT